MFLECFIMVYGLLQALADIKGEVLSLGWNESSILKPFLYIPLSLQPFQVLGLLLIDEV